MSAVAKVSWFVSGRWRWPFPQLTVDEEDIFSAVGSEEVAGFAAVGAIVRLVE